MSSPREDNAKARDKKWINCLFLNQIEYSFFPSEIFCC
jgi:hypothetical protein